MISNGEPTKAQPSTTLPGTRSLGVAAIDPVPLFRDGLATLVHRTPGLAWVGYAGNHHIALQLCEQQNPNVVFLDSGLDPNCHLTRLLTSGDPGLVVVLLVREAQQNPEYLGRAIGVGAHAIVPRAVEGRRLLEAIKRARLERRYLDPALTALTARPKRQQVRPDGELVNGCSSRAQMPLSRREYQVLQLLAEGLENSAIAKVLYLSVETVRTHVKSILRKLNARDRTHAVTLAFRSRILVLSPDSPLVPVPEARKGRQQPPHESVPAEQPIR